jgi:GDP-4-dehydro-6-deoxy-D-mannose reductase
MRCLVTGITGFVGGHLTKLLLARGDEVIGTSNDIDPAGCRENLKLFHVDITDGAGIARLVQESQPDRVYHLAALSSPAESLGNERSVYDTNFFGTLNLLEAVRCCTPQAHVLLVGSTQCYGNVSEAELPIREEQPFAPRNPYALSKAAGDLLGFQFFARYGSHIVRARPANHTGPGQSPAFVCSDFARQAAAIELGLSAPVLRVGNIGVSRDFCDVRDVVRAYAGLLENGHPGEAYNIGSGGAIALKEITGILTSFCSRPVQIAVESERARPDDAKSIYVSVAKIAAHTGWVAEYDLRTTLRDLFEYWVLKLGKN